MLSRGMCAIPFSLRWLLLIICMPRFLRRFLASLAPASPRLMFPFAALAELSSMRCLSLILLLKLLSNTAGEGMRAHSSDGM